MRTRHLVYAFAALLLISAAAPYSAADPSGALSAFVAALARQAFLSGEGGTPSSVDRPARGIRLVPAAEQRRPVQPHWAAGAEDEHAAIAVIDPNLWRAEPIWRASSIARRTLLVSAIAGASEYALLRFARAAALLARI